MGGNQSRLILSLFSLLLFTVQAAIAGDRGHVHLSHPRFYAVTGAVASPGVYEYSSQKPGLQDLVQHAGNVTRKASGAFRIFRAGEMGPRRTYHPGVRMPLQDGDVVIIDEQTVRTGQPQQHAPYVAVVGLLERPVVLRVNSERATVGRLMSDLNQDSILLPYVKVYLSNTSQVAARADRAAYARLSSGSVMQFDPSMVQRKRVPDLTVTKKPEISSIQTADYRRNNPRNSAQILQVSSVAEYPNEQSRLAHLGTENWGPRDLEMQPDPSALPPQNGIPQQPQPESWKNTINENVQKYPESSAWNKLPPAPAVSAEIEADAADAPIILEENPENAESSSFFSGSAVQWLTLTILGGLLGGAWRYKQRLYRSSILSSIEQTSSAVQINPLPAQVSAQASPKSRSTLDALIENSLPLVKEPTPVPKVLELHNQPVVRKNYRMDAEHQVPRPHIAPVTPVKPPVEQPIIAVQQETSLRKLVSEILLQQPSSLSVDVPAFQKRPEIPVEPPKNKIDHSLDRNVEKPTSTEMMFSQVDSFIAFAHPAAWSDLPTGAISETQSFPERIIPEEPIVKVRTNSIRVDVPQAASTRLHVHSSGGVLDRALGALHGSERH